MAKILVPISNGFEEIEAISIIDICRRADIEVVIAALEELETVGSHNIKIIADCKIEEVKAQEFEMIVLPVDYQMLLHLQRIAMYKLY